VTPGLAFSKWPYTTIPLTKDEEAISDVGSRPLRVASSGTGANKLPSTTASTAVTCWDPSLDNPGAVEIATTGTWNGGSIGLKGAVAKNYNHARIGVVTSADSSV
jgi:hypothetical protein